MSWSRRQKKKKKKQGRGDKCDQSRNVDLQLNSFVLTNRALAIPLSIICTQTPSVTHLGLRKDTLVQYVFVRLEVLFSCICTKKTKKITIMTS